MSQTSGDSKNYDVVCISFGKENEKGIQVTEANKKDSFLEQTMEIPVGTCELAEVVSFEDYKKIRENNKCRLTKHASEMAEKRGNKAEIISYNLKRAEREGRVVDINKFKSNKKADREIAN